MKRHQFSRLAIVVYFCLAVGCGKTLDPGEAVARANSTNLQRIANLYVAYQAEQGWVGPPDEGKFREFISALPPDKLKLLGVDPGNIDGLFLSERDGQPFKIRYKVVGNMMGSTEPIVFESVGVDGTRMVGTLNMRQMEVEEAEAEALFAGKSSTPPGVARTN